MKKVFAIALALIFALSVTFTVVASGEDTKDPKADAEVIEGDGASGGVIPGEVAEEEAPGRKTSGGSGESIDLGGLDIGGLLGDFDIGSILGGFDLGGITDSLGGLDIGSMLGDFDIGSLIGGDFDIIGTISGLFGGSGSGSNEVDPPEDDDNDNDNDNDYDNDDDNNGDNGNTDVPNVDTGDLF